jgi:hypothetical protein
MLRSVGARVVERARHIEIRKVRASAESRFHLYAMLLNSSNRTDSRLSANLIGQRTFNFPFVIREFKFEVQQNAFRRGAPAGRNVYSLMILFFSALRRAQWLVPARQFR